MNAPINGGAVAQAMGRNIEDEAEELSLHDPCIKGPWTDVVLEGHGLSGVKLHFFKEMMCTWHGLKAVTKLLAADSAAKEDVAGSDDYTYRSPFDSSNMRCAQYALARVLESKFEKLQTSEFWSELRADLLEQLEGK